jgi:hypothetical protein
MDTGSLHFLVIGISSAMNMRVQMSLWYTDFLFPLDAYTGVGYGRFILSFEEAPYCFL